MSEVVGGEGGPSFAPEATDNSQSSTAAPAPPPPSAGGSDDEDHGPNTFSKETGVEVEVPAAMTQRIADYKCEWDGHVSTRASSTFPNRWGVLLESDVEGKEGKFLCKATWQCAARTQISCRDGHTSNANKHMSNKHGLVGVRSNSQGYQPNDEVFAIACSSSA